MKVHGEIGEGAPLMSLFLPSAIELISQHPGAYRKRPGYVSASLEFWLLRHPCWFMQESPISACHHHRAAGRWRREVGQNCVPEGSVSRTLRYRAPTI